MMANITSDVEATFVALIETYSNQSLAKTTALKTFDYLAASWKAWANENQQTSRRSDGNVPRAILSAGAETYKIAEATGSPWVTLGIAICNIAVDTLDARGWTVANTHAVWKGFSAGISFFIYGPRAEPRATVMLPGRDTARPSASLSQQQDETHERHSSDPKRCSKDSEGRLAKWKEQRAHSPQPTPTQDEVSRMSAAQQLVTMSQQRFVAPQPAAAYVPAFTEPWTTTDYEPALDRAASALGRALHDPNLPPIVMLRVGKSALSSSKIALPPMIGK